MKYSLNTQKRKTTTKSKYFLKINKIHIFSQKVFNLIQN